MENNTTKYLYGAAVQGIQNFIFQTNELRDIVGASELVEKICTSLFNDQLKACDIKKVEKNAIVMAAGNIKYIFDSKVNCEKIVRIFPKTVMENAPGITISQAVVKYGSNEECKTFDAAVQKLESRLRIQRNRPARSMTLGIIGVMRSRKTGLPSVEKKNDEYLDLPTLKKRKIATKNNVTFKLCEKFFGKITYNNVAYNITNLTGNNDWIAIIHADGNGLGQVVQKVGKERETFKKFSVNLDKATKYAANQAFKRLGIESNNYETIPLRPIVLSGDDLTIICRADIALDFAYYFMDEFEYATGRGDERPKHDGIAEVRKIMNGIIKDNKVFIDGSSYLSACAGIAYIKSSYPFYSGYELAETLCGVAKKEAKNISGGMNNLPPSCLMFHKVQSSFIEEYDQIRRKELTASDIDFSFGPYYLDKQNNEVLKLKNISERWTIGQLTEYLDLLGKDSKEGRAVKNHLRECCNLLFYNKGLVEQRMKRLLSIVEDKALYEFVKHIKNHIFPIKTKNIQQVNNINKRSPLYDLLSIYSIQNIKTKTED